ncbi:hypothetical protein V490_06389 [Pseudogymnoascus sp. VKM F-3557]|nr:hypothetical protein V490_06389 [Pseudogymnoascus sp. VKM F-3557]
MAALERARQRMANLGDEMALCFDDEVICEGSDAEDSPLAKAERQKRRDAIELRYLAGHAPLIMSAQLKGPFNKNSGWVNPWRSKRPTEKQSRNKTTATEPRSFAHKTTSASGLGKRSRNDHNLPSSVGMRTKALAECSSTSMDIVNNRQPERPQLHSGFKRFAANQGRRPSDFVNLNERENILQKPNAGIKRRADTNWLKGADVGKRSRNNWSDPTSPTPKERTRDITGNDKAVLDTSSVPMSSANIAKFNRQLLSETATLRTSTPNFQRSKSTPTQGRGDGNAQATSSVTTKATENKRRCISMGPDSVSRKNPSDSERLHVESLSNASSEDEDGSYPVVETGRIAPEYSLNESLFVEPESSFRHKSVQSFASFEPSPSRTVLRSQLDEEILYGLSQASDLARSAERLTPLKPNGPRSSQVSSLSSNHASQARSQSHPLPKNAVELQIPKPKRNDRSRSFDSPLPPGSLKYRRVRRKAATPAKDRQDTDTSKAITKQKIPEAALRPPGAAQDGKHDKGVRSSGSQVSNQIDVAKPQFPISNSKQQAPDSVPIIDITDDDGVENSEAQRPLDSDVNDRTPSVSPVPHVTTEKRPHELENAGQNRRKPITGGRGSETIVDAPAISREENGQSEGLVASQQASMSQPRIENAAEKSRDSDVEHRETEPPLATDSIVAEEPKFGDKLLQSTGSQLAAPDLTDNDSTLGQIIEHHASKGPSSKSSPLPPLPDVDDDQASEASFVSATEESNSNLPLAAAVIDDDQVSEASFASAPEEVDSVPVPQSPWVAEEDIPAPKSISAEPTAEPFNFWMSQSKDADLLLADTESHCSAADTPNGDTQLSEKISEAPVQNTEAVEHNSELPQSNGFVASGPMLSGSTPRGSSPKSPKCLSPRKSHTLQPAEVGNHDLLSLSNPWVNNTQSPIVHPRPTKAKKRVSFSPHALGCDNDDAGGNEPDQTSNNAPEPRDLSSPPPPPEAESLTEGDNGFHRKLKWTSGILSRRASKGLLGSVSREDAVPPDSPGVGAMAEAFLAADARIQPANRNPGEECGKDVVTEAEDVDTMVEDGVEQDKAITAPAGLAIPMMTESQLVNPWGDEDEAPPFSMAEYGTRDDDDGLVEDVLSDMDAMLGDWNVDAELERAKREGRGKAGRDVTARERLVGTGY